MDGPGGPQDTAVAEAVIRLSQALGLVTLVDDVEVPAAATDLRQAVRVGVTRGGAGPVPG